MGSPSVDGCPAQPPAGTGPMVWNAVPARNGRDTVRRSPPCRRSRSLTEVLIAVLVLAVLLGVVLLVLRARRARQAPRPRRVDPLANQPELYDPHKIGVGDVITYAGIDHVVRGTIVLEQGGVYWREHLLDGSTGRRWLTVEDDEG